MYSAHYARDGYNVAQWTVATARALALVAGAAAPIPTARHYVRSVRKIACERVADYRLLAPLWRDAPVRPSAHGRIATWVAYWAETQPRPDVVGSSYNDAPAHAVRAWRLGIPAAHYPRHCVHLLPARWRGGRERILAVLRLARKADRQECARLPDTLRTADIRRLGRLPRWALRALLSHAWAWFDEAGRRVDWFKVRAILEEIRPHRPGFQTRRVPATRWLTEVERLRDPEYARQAAREEWIATCPRAEDGGLVGVRYWVVPRDTPVLHSPYQNVPWPMPWLRATNWPGSQGAVRNEAGVHAYWDVEAAVYASYDLRPCVHVSLVRGDVRGYGQFVAGPEGWRAEEVVMVSLTIVQLCRNSGEKTSDAADSLQKLAGALQERYGVPVTSELPGS